MSAFADSLKEKWEVVEDGWRDIWYSAKNALTRFRPETDEDEQHGMRWGLVAAEVSEHDNRYVVSVELPGMSATDVKVELADDVLTITGTKHRRSEHREGNRHLVEVAYGRFSRSIALPDGVNADDVKATFKDGVLSLDVGKQPSRASKRIEITTQ